VTELKRSQDPKNHTRIQGPPYGYSIFEFALGVLSGRGRLQVALPLGMGGQASRLSCCERERVAH